MLVCLFSNNQEPSSEDHENSGSNHENRLFDTQQPCNRQQQDAYTNNFQNNLDEEAEESEERDDTSSPPPSVNKRPRPNKRYIIPGKAYRVLSRRSRRPRTTSFFFLFSIIEYVPDPLKGLLRPVSRCFTDWPRRTYRRSRIKWSCLPCAVIILLAFVVQGSESTPLNKTRVVSKHSGARQNSKCGEESKRDDIVDRDFRLELDLILLACVVVVSVLFLIAQLPNSENRCDATPLPAELSPQQVKPGPQDNIITYRLTTPASKLHLLPSLSPSVPDPEIPPPTQSEKFESFPSFVEPVQCDDTASRELITEAKSVVLSEERWREACGGGLFEGKQPVLVIEGGTFKLDNIAATTTTTSVEGGASCVPLDRLVLPQDPKATLIGDLSGRPDACVRPDEPEQPDASVPAIAELDASEEIGDNINRWLLPQQEETFPTQVSTEGRHVPSALVTEKLAFSLPPVELMVLPKSAYTPHLTLLDIAAVHQVGPAGAQNSLEAQSVLSAQGSMVEPDPQPGWYGLNPRSNAHTHQPQVPRVQLDDGDDDEKKKKVVECFPCAMDYPVIRVFPWPAP